MDNVTKIVYKNNAYSLEGYDMQTALDLLHIDVNSVNMEVEGDTLYIMAKAGSKGVISLKDLDPNKKEEGRFAVKFVDGKLVKEEHKTVTPVRPLTIPAEEYSEVFDSSVIHKASWVNNAMYIAFKNGAVYKYPGADYELFRGLVEAESKGRFFNAEISSYGYVKI